MAKNNADESALQVFHRICHERGSEGGCSLFPTKPESVPDEIAYFVAEAEELRNLRLAAGGDKWLPPLSEIQALDFEAFDSAEAMWRMIENEPEEEGKSKNNDAVEQVRQFFQLPAKR